MADRMIAWLDHCGYEIVEKKPAPSVVPEKDISATWSMRE